MQAIGMPLPPIQSTAGLSPNEAEAHQVRRSSPPLEMDVPVRFMCRTLECVSVIWGDDPLNF
jgi:hypothetical protein